ncbi:amino acid adenylation domain-containing protein [Paenibacillus sp. sgz500958]|uniref:non-ribosomal peptide synthetase n=1 Tax=Paenibacillus sp. sgz500958 TaxID=3242475 RepID=UPI0036D3D7A6
MSTVPSRKIDKDNVEDMLPLTPVQEGMLYHSASGRDGEHYFQQLRLRLTGKLDMEAMRRAWQFVAETNEMLRTIYRWERLNSPVQIVLKKLDIPWILHEFTTLSAKEQTVRVDEVILQDKQLGINIQEHPFRITVCRLGEETCEMLLSWHHILYDGWSNGIVLGEFFEAYTLYASGHVPTVRRKTKYKEFIKWQRQQDKEKQQQYWEEYLSQCEACAQLPQDEDTSGRKGGIQNVRTSLSSGKTKAVLDFARRNGVTPASLFYSAWGLILQRYSCSRDVLFGTTVSGRVPEIGGMEDMVGLFINTLPLRIRSAPSETLLDFVKGVDASLRSRKEAECTPLIDIGTYSGLKSNAPLFNTIVVLENYPPGHQVRDGSLLRVDNYSMEESNPYALTLGIITGEELELEFSYDEGSFTRATVERIAGHYMQVLRQMVESPQQRLQQVNLLTAGEQQQILTGFNRLAVPVPDHIPLHRQFEHQVERTPEQIAATDDGQCVSYRKLNEGANRLARLLVRYGTRPDQPVALHMERSVRLITAMLAVWKAGGCYIPIDKEYAVERVTYILQDSAAEVLITEGNAGDQISFAGTVINLDDVNLLEENPSFENEGNLPDLCRTEHLAYILYTSGTTGNPKGVLVEHRNLSGYVQAFQNEFALTPQDAVLQQSSCSFDTFAEEVCPALLHGAATVVVQKSDVLNLENLSTRVREHGITVISCSPLLLHEINKREGFPGVHTYISGGDVLKPEYITSLIGAAKVYNSYGPTEGTVCATYFRCESHHHGTIPIGRPVLNYKVYILDEADHLQPIGVSGEICISGVGVARGYLNETRLNEQQFVSDPFDSQLRMYRTGDVGKWLPEGTISFLGRNDDQVKIRGFRVEPAEIEHRLLENAGIQEAIVLPYDDASGIKGLAAYMKCTEDLSVRHIKVHLQEWLPHYMIPSRFYRIGEVPVTVNGKLDKKALAECGQLLLQSVEPRGAFSGTESKIAAVWREVLKLEYVGLHDPFFDIGGNSILLMQLQAKLEKEYYWGIQIVDLFAASTVYKLAVLVDSRQKAVDDSIFYQYQSLPQDFFGRNREAHGAGLIRFHLQGRMVQSIRHIAAEHTAEWNDVLISMYVFLFTQVTGAQLATIQYLMDDCKTAVPLCIELDRMKDFGELYADVHVKRITAADDYTLNMAEKVDLNKPDGGILPLVYCGSSLSVDAKLLEIYDITLGMEYDSYEQRITFTCSYNDRRMKKDKVSQLMNGYAQVLEQLTQRFSVS